MSYTPLWQEYTWKEKFAGLLPWTLPHPEGWQIPQECDPVYLSDELYYAHGSESDYRMAGRKKEQF